MRNDIRLLDPIRWRPGLAGGYPGQESFIELGAPPVRMVFCWCPPTPADRRVLIGSPADEPQRDADESQRPIELSGGFWLAEHLVNQQQWEAVMGANPSRRGKGDLCPVDSVSWNDAQGFCRKAGLRLPREAEWEYACRAGTITPFGVGGGHCLNAQMANFDGNYPYGSGREAFKWLYRERTLAQGSFPPNAWGLHDLHGQLWEWCEDEFAAGDRVLRGGRWILDGRFARSAYRNRYDPEDRVEDSRLPALPQFHQCSRRGQRPRGCRGAGQGVKRAGERNDGPAQRPFFLNTMSFAFFQLPTDASAEVAAPLNAFLRSHRIVRVVRQWCEAGKESAWAFCVEYVEGTTFPSGVTAKVDYREVLPPEQFEVFARLRTLRKTLSEQEGQPVFAIFTNAQLAEIVQRGCQTVADLKAIAGVGEARVAKYGAAVLGVLQPTGGAA